MGKREESILEGMGRGEMALFKGERCVGRMEGEEEEEQLRKDKKWSERILSSMIEYQERKQSHQKWLDTLTLTDEERKVAGKEAMMDRALEMIERDTITEKNWAHFLVLYKKFEEVQGTTGETNQSLERLAVEQIEEYNKWADGLNLGAEERTLLDKLRRLALRELKKGLN
jgi:tRNA uridine 5-carbamoylmethylation protein Kti12